MAGEPAGQIALEELVGDLFARQHVHLVGQLTRHLYGDTELAEDAMAFAWLQLVRTRPEGDNLEGWLYTVARHEAYAELRRRRRLVSLEAAEQASDSGAGDPVWIAEDRAEDARLAALVSQLPGHQRLVLSLQAQGYSYQQICLATGKTYTWVNRHLREGRARLRRLTEPG